MAKSKAKPGKINPGKTREEDQAKWWRDRKTVVMLFLVLLVTFIVMSPSLRNDFVSWDDDINVYENPNIRGLNGDNIQKIFSSHIIGGYTPLTILTFAVEHELFGLNPKPYHATNLVLHLINVLLVFWLATLLGLKQPWALLAALIFGIQPMRVESVAWVTERKDVLFAAFYFAALICYILHHRLKKAKYLILVYLFFILSLLSKIQAVSLPLSMLAVDYLLRRPLRMPVLLEKIPYFALSLATGLIGIHFLGQQKSLDPIDYSLFERILIGFYSLMVYLGKSVFPWELSAIYPFPKPGAMPAAYYAAPFIIAGLAWLVYHSTRQTRAFAFGGIFFLVNVMFVLQVVSAGQGFITDRFTYVPYFGIFFAFAYGLQWLYESRRNMKTVVIGVVAIYSIAMAVVSFERCKVWKNTETLFTDVLEKHKNVAVAYNNRGRYYREQKQYDRAIADYTSLLALKPEDHSTFVGRGRLYFDMKDYDKAIGDFNKAIALNSGSSMAFSNRGAIFGMRRQYDQAFKDLDRALELDPKLKDALLNRSLAYFETGQYEKCIQDCEVYLKLIPDDADTYNQLAVCKAALGRYAAAEADYTKAIGLNSRNGIFFLNRSYLYNQMGDKARAIKDARTAMQMGVRIEQTYKDNLGL